MWEWWRSNFSFEMTSFNNFPWCWHSLWNVWLRLTLRMSLCSGCEHLSHEIFFIFQNVWLPHIAWCLWKKLHRERPPRAPEKAKSHQWFQKLITLEVTKSWDKDLKPPMSRESIDLLSIFMCKLYMLLLILRYLGYL